MRNWPFLKAMRGTPLIINSTPNRVSGSFNQQMELWFKKYEFLD